MTEPAAAGLSRGQTLLFAAATGLVVGNIYFAQPLVGLIGPEIGLAEGAASLVVTLTQLGYAAGLLLLVPLGDRVENRRLIAGTTLACVAALAVVATARTGPVFLLASFALGLASTCVQMLIPLAAHLTPPASRGRVVGNIMSGLLFGILIARPVSSALAHAFGWRSVFAAAAIVDAGVALVLWRALPVRRPEPAGSYRALLGSLWPVLRDHPVLQRRLFYQASLFAAFTLFWTAVPLHLAGPFFGLNQDGIAVFALCGAAGALTAPFAGRLADRGHGRPATFAALLVAGLAFAAAGLLGRSLAGLGAAVIVLDAAVTVNQIIGQRAIYGLAPELRSRITALYIAGMFLGGAVGSALASPLFTAFGWTGVAALGTGLPALALAGHLIHRARDRKAGRPA